MIHPHGLTLNVDFPVIRDACGQADRVAHEGRDTLNTELILEHAAPNCAIEVMENGVSRVKCLDFLCEQPINGGFHRI